MKNVDTIDIQLRHFVQFRPISELQAKLLKYIAM